MHRIQHTNNAVFSLCYHFVSVVKYRQKVFTDDAIISDLKTIMCQIATEFDVEIIEQECGDDHLHILFATKPTIDMTKFINYLNGRSSRLLREKHKDFLKNKLWGDSFWSPSYFLATTGNTTIDILKAYVENQRTLQE